MRLPLLMAVLIVLDIPQAFGTRIACGLIYEKVSSEGEPRQNQAYFHFSLPRSGKKRNIQVGVGGHKGIIVVEEEEVTVKFMDSDVFFEETYRKDQLEKFFVETTTPDEGLLKMQCHHVDNSLPLLDKEPPPFRSEIIEGDNFEYESDLDKLDIRVQSIRQFIGVIESHIDSEVVTKRPFLWPLFIGAGTSVSVKLTTAVLFFNGQIMDPTFLLLAGHAAWLSGILVSGVNLMKNRYNKKSNKMIKKLIRDLIEKYKLELFHMEQEIKDTESTMSLHEFKSVVSHFNDKLNELQGFMAAEMLPLLHRLKSMDHQLTQSFIDDFYPELKEGKNVPLLNEQVAR